MRIRFSLQWRILVLIAGGMTLILVLSAYLHEIITRQLIEDAGYNSALSRTVAIAERIAALQLYSNPEALREDIRLVAEAPQDPGEAPSEHQPFFAQIDVYQPAGQGLRLAATTTPAASRLRVLDANATDNDLGEMERPLPEVVSMEVLPDGTRYWLISVAIKERTGTGYVTALVHKNSFSPTSRVVQFQHNLVLLGAIAVCVVLFYVMFAHFFRRPARDIVRAMALARRGNFESRAPVRRHDELGEIARSFNAMMDDLSARDSEREELVTKIGGFNSALRGEVERATAELRAVNEALFQSQQRLGRSERLAAVGQVAASLAHEIGTPLNSISGHLQLLGRRLPGDADAQRRIGIISRQLDSIVDSVRALLRRTHKRRASLRPTDLSALVSEVLRLVGPTLESHRIAAAVGVPRTLPAVLVDRDSLHQVFLNLINNSIDAMPGGGQIEIDANVDAAGGAIDVTVKDTGPGIPADALDHLFEPTWTTKETGSGFGLAIAREIMSQAGGRIDVENASPSGAIFRLRVPLAPVAATAS